MSTHNLDIRKWREDIGLSQAKLAELTGIPQYMISAHELGKDSLSENYLRTIVRITSNTDAISSTISRRKRYQPHSYEAIAHDPVRLNKYIRTTENSHYLNQLSSISKGDSDCNFSALSLFSGCGGLCLGFKAAGFTIKGHLDIDVDIKRIHSANFSNSLDLGDDIQSLQDDDIRQIHDKFSNIDLIIGGPPCQGFSLSGKRQSHDPRNFLFLDYLRFVDIFKPKVALMENVRLLTSMKNPHGGFVKDDIIREFSSRGYWVQLFDINAKDYGVPQHRERVIFMAVNKNCGFMPSLPEPRFGETNDLLSNLLPYRTFADACSDLRFLESGEHDEHDGLHSAVEHPKHVIDWLWDVPEGFSAHDNLDPSKRPPSGYNTTYKRQVWFEPASTVQTTFGMISGCRNVHPIATRSLTIREAARIQSFPDPFVFSGSLGTIRTAIGNAVPPLLSFTIARHVRSLLSNLVKVPGL